MASIKIPQRSVVKVSASTNAGAPQRAQLTLRAENGAVLSLPPIDDKIGSTELPGFPFDCLLEVVGQYWDQAWRNSSERYDTKADIRNGPISIFYNDAGVDSDYDDLIIKVQRIGSSPYNSVDRFLWLGLLRGAELQQQSDQVLKLSAIVDDFPFIADVFEGRPATISSSDLPYIKERLNDAEKKLFDEDELVGLRVLWHAKQASDEAPDRYANSELSNGNGDAFRHCYWNARMRHDSSVGLRWAERWGNAHEESPSNPQLERTMDLFNNQVGRDAASSDEDAIQEMVRSGRCRVIRSGSLVPSDRTGESAVV